MIAMTRINRQRGKQHGARTAVDFRVQGDEIVVAMGSAERKAQTLAETPSEFAPPGDNPYRVSTTAPPVDAPRTTMARGRNRRPLI